ncbi:MAG: D-aminoacylase [Acidobacteria bacterium]|nr:MAG: D-aminoacylase [Acidobacteriota bacterium]REK03104.1 MAG: D-aminoacylase [Acidobacteriota bacterium]REK15452.1 MAG: D-aminoacylase [Acidobacteriota bacterium]REK45802.1 MAG: D-aminoacylase [Acidobacteriota bacterium]
MAQNGSPTYDIVIRNGKVLDGAGNPWIRADVAIRDGKFVKIGVVPGKGKREIDATGRYVTPGFIDMLDQSGGTLTQNGLAESKLLQGITTGIAGEGGTPVPAENLAEYFSKLESDGIGMNFGTSFAERQARVAVLGSEDRDPNEEELERMRGIVETAMKAGALGITTALIYPPASYAETEELIEMAKVAGKHGGFYSSHIRGEGKELIEAIEEAIEIGEKAGVPVEVFHLKAAYQPGWGTLMKKAGETIEAARARGLDIAANIYLYEAGGTGLAAVIPSWAADGGREKLMERLKDPEIRERLKREIKTGSPGWWNIVEASGGWENVLLVYAGNKDNERFENKNLAEIAREWNKDPADAAFDLILQGEGRVSALYFMMSGSDIEMALKFPWTSLGSDAAASVEMPDPSTVGMGHPRGYGNFPRIISQYVREKKLISLPEAIRKLTSWPATRMRIPSRGMIKEGLWADVVIFDLETISDTATYEHPFGRPRGIDWVLVNGEVTIEKGRHTGAKAGRVIYGPGNTVN